VDISLGKDEACRRPVPAGLGRGIFVLASKTKMVRLDRIELSTPAWKAEVLPLNYSRETGRDSSGGPTRVKCWSQGGLHRRPVILETAEPAQTLPGRR
jgi:hypothetical protein